MKDYIGIARNKKDSENGYATKDYIGIAKKKSSNGDGNVTNNNILKKRGTGNTNAGINVTNSQNPVITTTRKTGSVISPAEKLGREVSSRPDFIELSKPKERGVWDTDSRYKAVNDIGGWQDFLAQSDTRSVEENYKYMTEAEKGVYNYLYNTEGEKSANEYLEELEYDLNERGMKNFQAEYEQYAREHPIAASAGSVLTNGIGGIVGSADIIGQNVANVGRSIIGEETKPIDYNRPGQQGTVMTDAIRSTVSEELNKNGTLDEDVPLLGGLGLGDLYQLGMSMADSSAVALTGGSAGTAILGSAAASSSMRDASERGLSDRQILLTGIASGTAEALFEKVSIENLLKPKNGAAIGQAVKNILKQGGVEASEETFTTIANTISEGIINGDKSELNTAIDQYIQSGMTEGEAKKQAAKDWVKGLALDALGGFISGGVMGAGFEAGTRASYNSAGRRIASDNSALDSLREAAGEYGVSLSENPSYREAGRALRTVDFNRATGFPKSTAENITDTAEDSTAEPSSSMLRAVYDRDDGSYGDSYIVGVKNGGIEFEDGEVKSLADIRVDDPEAESVIRYAVEKGDGGNTVITAWNNGVMEGKRQNSTDFIYQFENAEEYGRLGAGLDYAKNSEAVNALTPTQIELAYNSGTGQSVRTLSQEVSEAKIKAETAEKQAQAERISKATGRDIVFYESENASENGYFNPNDGKIYINSGSKNAVAQIISHELTHSIETSSSYGELSGLVFDRLKATGEDINALRTAKRELYERNGVTLADETAIDQEIVAEYVEKNLLTDEKSIRELVIQKRSLAQRISDWIDRVLAKLGNRDAGERAFLNRAKRLYAKALRETEVDRGGKVQYNIDKNNAGGDIDGREREMGNSRGRLGNAKKNTGKQSGVGRESVQKYERMVAEGRRSAGDHSKVYVKDNEGRGISKEVSDRLDGTIIVDNEGNPIAVYHSTPNMDFTEFAVGDTGFHFGSEDQAAKRAEDKGKGRTIKAYLNIKNPINFDGDLTSWKANSTAIHFWNRGIISEEEYLRINDLYVKNGGAYDAPASVELRRILAEKGYDGIVYENEIEGEGKSYIAFYPEQVVIFDDGKNGAKFSISESYPDEIDEWDRNGRRDDELFVLGTTGDVIQGLGARENDIYIKSEKINKILVDHPEMTLDEIKKIPEILEYPIMILKSKNRANVGDNNTRLVVFGNIKAKNGNPILSVLDLSPIEKRTAISDMQKVNSAYTKTRNMKRFMESSEVLYADKKRTASLLRTMGFLAPIELQRVGSIGSIGYSGQNVNLKGVPFTDILGNDNQYSISDDEEMRELNTKEEKLATELSEIEQQYLIAQIEQGKKDAKELRIEKDKLKKQMESLEKRNSRKAKTQLKQYQRKLDKMVDRIAYKDGQLKTLKQNKNDAVLAARIAEGRAWSEKYGRDISELQEKISRKNAELKAARQRRDELLAKKDEKFRKYKETRRKSILRGQIKSLVRDFNARLDRPNQKKYIPKELVTAVIDLTSAINVENDSASPKIQERLEHMKAVYDRYENDPDYAVYDDFVSEMIDQVTKEIGDTPLRDMTESQLRMVYDTLTAFSRAVTDSQRFVALQYDKSIYQAGTDAINEIKNSKLRFKGDGVNNFVNWLLTPERFFNRLGGYRKNGIWEKVGKSLNESTQKAIGVSREFYYKFREFSDGSYADSLADQKNIYDVGLRDENGNSIKVTRGQMISVYMHLTSEDNRRAIQYGGLSVPDMNAYYKGNTKNAFGKNKIRTVGLSQEMRTLRADYVSTQEKLQELLTKYTKDGEVQYNSINEIDTQMIDQYQKNIEDIEAQMETSLKNSDNYIAGIEENINKFLTDEDKKFIKTLRDWYKYSADKINEVTMRMYGIKRATVDNYYTIHRDPDLLAKEFSDIVMDFSLESWGSLKERVPSVQPILLTDVMFDVSDHANELSQYYGYVEMMRDFNKLYNTRSGNTSVKEAVARKLGAGNTKIAGVTGGQYIENLMADIVGARAKQGSFLSILRRNVTRSALTVNIRVAFSQLSGTLSAPAEVGWKATIKGMGKGAIKSLSPKYKEELARLNEFYYERYKGEGGMREFSEVKVADNVLDKIWNKIDDKTKGWLLNWSRTVDAYSTAVMYSMAEEYVKDTLEISPKDGGYLEEVNRKFTDILIHTQPQSDTALRSDLFRETREGYSFVTLFKSQSNQFFNMLYDASARVWTYQNAVKNGDKSVTKDDLYRAKRDLANAATTVIIGGSFGFAVTRFIANAILRHMDDYRDDDDEVTAQSIALGIMNDSISSFAGILPLGEEIYDLIMASVSDRTYYGISEAGLQSLNDTFNGIVSFSGDVKDDEVTLESFTKLIKAAAPMLMIPYNSVNTLIEAAKGYMNDIPSGNFLTFEYGAERSSTTQGRRMYEAVFEGDMEKYAAVRDEMIQDGVEKGKTEEEAVKDVVSAFKRAVKDSFAEGDIDAKKAEDILKKYVYDGEEAENDAYWTIREWEAGGDFSRYDDLTEAVLKADGGAYKKALEELESHGTKESSIKSAITKAVKEAYLRGELSVSEAKNKLRVYNGLSSSEAIEKIREWREAA